jgi:hypothetical protein
MPIEIGPSRRCAPGVGLRRRKEGFFGRRRPTVGRRLSRRLKSAPQGAARRASAFADAKRDSSVGAGRPLAEGSAPIEKGACAPGVGLRRRKEGFFSAQAKALRAGRRPSPTQRGILRSAQADRWPEALRRLKSASKALARRASAFADAKRDSSVGAGRPSAGGSAPERPNSFGAPCAKRRPPPTQKMLSGRRRPTVGRRPPEVEFIRLTSRPPAKGLPRSNSFNAQASLGPIPSACKRGAAFAPLLHHGRGRTRTCDPPLVRRMLSPLSYSPVFPAGRVAGWMLKRFIAASSPSSMNVRIA